MAQVKVPTRVDEDLMNDMRGLWAAEVRAGDVSLSLRELVERAFKRELRLAKRRGVKIRPMKSGSLPVGRRRRST